MLDGVPREDQDGGSSSALQGFMDRYVNEDFSKIKNQELPPNRKKNV